MQNLDTLDRTCTKTLQEWKEVDLTQSEVDNEPDEEPKAEEKQLEQLKVDEELDCGKVMAELECMKRRIKKLQLRLKTDVVCEAEPCTDLEIELNCSNNPEICALQKNHHKLQCQISELIRCCNVAKDQIEDLRARMCEKSDEIPDLHKTVCQLEAWRSTLQHEFGACYERFQYLKHVKAEWKDVYMKIEEQKRCYKELEDSFVPKVGFLEEKRQVIDQIEGLRELLQDMFHMQTARVDPLEQRLASIEATITERQTPIKQEEI